QRAGCKIQRVVRYVQRTGCKIQRVVRYVQGAGCKIQRVVRNGQRAGCKIQRVVRYVQRTGCKIQRVVRNGQREGCKIGRDQFYGQRAPCKSIHGRPRITLPGDILKPESATRGPHSPPQLRRGGCAVNKKMRSHLIPRRRGGVDQPPLILLTSTTPAAPFKDASRPLLYVAALPSSAEEGSCTPNSFVLTGPPISRPGPARYRPAWRECHGLRQSWLQ